ncbi:MAG: hypothetical protein DWQ49_08890 [Bacteroidetes bacterium]|nr:MAG: hypothetical protein DWQ49_08890 [Bacteroidota bacterium]
MLQDFSYTGTLTNTPVLITENFKTGTAYLVWADGFNRKNVHDTYIQLFDAQSTSDVTLGTTDPILTFPLPLRGAHDWQLPVNDYFQGKKFKHGVVAAATQERKGTTAPDNAVDVNFIFV